MSKEVTVEQLVALSEAMDLFERESPEYAMLEAQHDALIKEFAKQTKENKTTSIPSTWNIG